MKYIAEKTPVSIEQLIRLRKNICTERPDRISGLFNAFLKCRFSAAEKELESIISVMVSGYSDQGYEWTILEKCVEDQKAIQGTDLSTQVL